MFKEKVMRHIWSGLGLMLLGVAAGVLVAKAIFVFLGWENHAFMLALFAASLAIAAVFAGWGIRNVWLYCIVQGVRNTKLSEVVMTVLEFPMRIVGSLATLGFFLWMATLVVFIDKKSARMNGIGTGAVIGAFLWAVTGSFLMGFAAGAVFCVVFATVFPLRRA